MTDELWDHAPPRTAASAVQVYISQLRQVLADGCPAAAAAAEPGEPREPGEAGPLLTIGDAGYRLRVRPEDLDLTVFEALHREGCGAAERGEYAFGAEVLRSALGLWRGPALAGVRHGPILASAVAYPDGLWLTALDRRINADLCLGRHAELTGELTALTHEYPLHEPFHAHLMVALFRSYRRADAVKAYASVCGTLLDAGIRPGAELRALYRRILTCDPVLTWPGDRVTTRV